MIGLPIPSARPVFQYYDPDTGSMQDITYPDGLQPRCINNYILDPSDWQDWQPPGHTSTSKPAGGGPPGSSNNNNNNNNNKKKKNRLRKRTTTRAAVLASLVDDIVPCAICSKTPAKCRGDSCARSFRARVDGAARAAELRIERVVVVVVGSGAGPAAAAAAVPGHRPYGVFCGAGVRRREVVGEYLGRLHPLGGGRAGVLQGGNAYSFELGGVATVDASEYGSITRFINHHCEPNLDVISVTYGRRRTVAFAARREIAPGEQLFIHYGDQYFNERRPCLCDIVPWPHIPGEGKAPPYRVP